MHKYSVHNGGRAVFCFALADLPLQEELESLLKSNAPE
jgi:hypothetical protein